MLCFARSICFPCNVWKALISQTLSFYSHTWSERSIRKSAAKKGLLEKEISSLKEQIIQDFYANNNVALLHKAI